MKLLISISIYLSIILTAFSGEIENLDFNPAHIKKVSILLVGEASALESSFGHLALRLSTDRKTTFEDYSVEFVADEEGTTNPFIFYIRGSGLIFPYETKVFVKNFENFKVEKNDDQNRSVKSVELNLSSEQVLEVAKFVKNFQQGKIKQNYKFLTENCAGIPLGFIEKVIGKDIDFSNVPNVAFEKLLDNPITGEVMYYPSSKEKRLEFYEKYISKFHLEISNILPVERFLEFLSSAKLKERINAYTVLAYLYQKEVISDRLYKWIFVKFRNLEYKQNQFNYKLGFSPESIKENRINFIRNKFSKSGRIKHFSSKIIKTNDGSLGINYSYSVKRMGKPSSNSHKEKNVTINIENSIIKGRDVYFDNQKVGFLFETENQNEIYTDLFGQTSFYYSKGNFDHFVSFYSTDFSIKHSNVKEKISKSRINLLNTSNKLKKETNVGACFGFVWLQKAFFERAFFFQKAENNLTSEELLKLVKNMIDGDYVIFQGIENIKELTGLIGEEKLIKLLLKIQNEKHLSKVDGFVDSVFNQEILNEKNIDSTVKLIKSGIALPLTLGYYKNNAIGMSQKELIGHIIYVYDIEKISNAKYKIIGYDPNFGVGHYYNLEISGDLSQLVLAGDGELFVTKSSEYVVRPILSEVDLKSNLINSFIRNSILDIKNIKELPSQSVKSHELYKLVD